MKEHIEVLQAPPIAIPNNGNLPPPSGGNAEVTALVITLLIGVVKAAPLTIRELRLFRRDGKKQPKSDKE
jgi:hypothetical protein